MSCFADGVEIRLSRGREGVVGSGDVALKRVRKALDER